MSRRRSPPWISIIAAMSFVVMASGCLPPPKPPELIETEKRVDELQLQNRELGRQLAIRDDRIGSLEEQIRILQERGPSPLYGLFRPTTLEIADRTGGADYDGKPGDDGVTVYLRPVDEDGCAVKAPGDIQIVLFDMNDANNPKEIGSYVVNEAEVLRRSFYCGWMTNHYTIKCAWPPDTKLPPSREVLIRATFVDAVTGDKLTATKQVKIEWVNRR